MTGRRARRRRARTAVDTTRKREEQDRAREAAERHGEVDPETGERDLLRGRRRHEPPDDAPFSAG